MQNKWISYCQFAFKARKIAYGSGLIPSIQKQQAKLVLYTETMGNNSKKKIVNKCAFYNIPCIAITQTECAQITREAYVAFAITDGLLAERIVEERKGMVMEDGLQTTAEKKTQS